jgi:hypothetical protein
MKQKGILIFLFICLAVMAFAQKKQAFVSGRVVDENENPFKNVSVVILGRTDGTNTNDSGYFRIKVPAGKPFALVFSHAGYKEVKLNFRPSENEEEQVTVRLEPGRMSDETAVVVAQNRSNDISLVKINPKMAFVIPSATGGIESLLKIYVGSNNELTSQYSVRGGNYDENLIYINDFEIFRPYLVRSGQQEGLSFINPEMTQNVYFQLGGFQARYGDKMSSVLDIQYRRPRQFGGSLYISLLEQGLHLEGATKNRRFTWLGGVRNRSNRNLLSSQETKGNYVPSSSDVQLLLSYQVSKKIQAEVLGNFSQTRFTLVPEFSQQSSAVFSPFFTANLGLDIFFEGKEKDQYATKMLGGSVTIRPDSSLRLKFLASRFKDEETENYDITGAYIFGERDFDKTKPTFGQIINPLGVGAFQNFARNTLDIEVLNFSHKGSLDRKKHYYQWGLGIDRTQITDKLNEWELHDSAGYTLPFNPNLLQMKRVLKTGADYNFNRFTGYIQDNISLSDSLGITLQAGVRFNYNTLNNEMLVSPRLGLAWKPGNWKRNFIFKLAAGAYHQPPFYRELRRPDGTLNRDLKAQRSYQFIAGADYNFRSKNRPFKFTAEAYYKNMSQVVPYDIDNVRLRYFGENVAKAYAAGLEMRLFGELVKDAESWVSLGFMKTKEDLAGDYYYQYKNAAGQIINAATEDKVVVDSNRVDIGWLRRPTDRTITFGLFFSDYLATNKNLKVYLNALYGSNMPYNLPGSSKYRNGLIIEPYLRFDLGFSALLLDMEKSNRRSHSPFKAFNNIWASLEVFNLIDRRNQISFLFIKDYANNTFSVPNRLTPRLVNLKLMARF